MKKRYLFCIELTVVFMCLSIIIFLRPLTKRLLEFALTFDTDATDDAIASWMVAYGNRAMEKGYMPRLKSVLSKREV